MSEVSRRAILHASVGIATAGLGGARQARAAELNGPALFADIDGCTRALRRAEIDGVDWQRHVRGFLERTPTAAIEAALDVDWTALDATARADGRAELRLAAERVRGGPAAPAYRRKLFRLEARRAIVPHGHRNIVSAFVVLRGRVRGRLFDRLREAPDAFVIAATDDRALAPGDAAASSDAVDNVHWFTALEDDTLLFNVSATVPDALRRERGPTGRLYLDPDGEVLPGGAIRAPRVSVATLRRKYDG